VPIDRSSRTRLGMADEIRDQIMSKSGVASLATPEDIAELTLFLCSPRARQIRGVAIAVDGGGTPGVY